MAELTCPRCGADAIPGAVRCAEPGCDGVLPCPHCGAAERPAGAERCPACREPLAFLELDVRAPRGLGVGDVAALSLRVRNPSTRPVDDVHLSLTNVLRFCAGGDTDVEVELPRLGPGERRELDLHLRPQAPGCPRLTLRAGLRDADRAAWLLDGRLDLPVARADGQPSTVVFGDVVNAPRQSADTVLRSPQQAGGVSIRVDGATACVRPGRWVPLPLTDPEVIPFEARPIEPGVVLRGRFRVRRELGVGAFGVVFLAEGDGPGGAPARYAVKTLRPELRSTPRARKAFEREARLAARLNEPHLVKLWDWGEHEGLPFLVFEYVDGPSCDDLLAEHPDGLPWPTVAGIAADVCAALDHAHTPQHDRGAVCHRDLKPANVLLTRDGTAKLADFNVGREIRTQMTRLTGVISAGTAAYMSREQLLNQRPAPGQDLWSLGVTLYELLTGEPPFAGDAGQVLSQIAANELPPLDGDHPPWFEAAVRRCLAADPADRWPSAAALAAALADRGSSAPPGAGRTRRDNRPRAPVASPAPGNTRVHEPTGITLVYVPAGEFTMGSPDDEEGRVASEGPQHRVRIPAPLWIGKHPVTNEQYRRFLESNPGHAEPRFWNDDAYNAPRQPVVGVSWADAQAFCAWAGLRLPSEAEWEYACRAGTTARFWAGDGDGDLARVGWFAGNSDGVLRPVGEKPANPWGLCDVHGNVWEWCEDDWHGDYDGAPDDGRAWIDSPRGALRVCRGGGFRFDAGGCRSAYRLWWNPTNRRDNRGFRVVLPAPERS